MRCSPTTATLVHGCHRRQVGRSLIEDQWIKASSSHTRKHGSGVDATTHEASMTEAQVPPATMPAATPPHTANPDDPASWRNSDSWVRHMMATYGKPECPAVNCPIPGSWECPSRACGMHCPHEWNQCERHRGAWANAQTRAERPRTRGRASPQDDESRRKWARNNS